MRSRGFSIPRSSPVPAVPLATMILCLLTAAAVPFLGASNGLYLVGIVVVVVAALVCPYAFLVLFALYIPFESMIIYRLPTDLYLKAKHAGTALSGVLALALVFRTAFSNQYTNRSERRSVAPVGLFGFAAFAAWAWLSSKVNGTEGGLVFRMLVQEARFVPMYLGIVFSAPKAVTVKRVLIFLFVAAAIQVGLGFAQFAVGGPVQRALALPEVQSDEGIVYARGSNVNTLSAEKIRMAGSTGSYNIFGVYLAIYILLAVCLLYSMRREVGAWRAIIVVFSIAAFVLVILSHSRMALACILAGTLAVGWLRRDWRIAVGFVLSLGLIALLFIYDQTDYSQFQDQGDVTWVQKVKSSVTPERLDTSKEVGRLGVTLYALDLSRQYPFFGVGPGYWGNILALRNDEHTEHVMLSRNIPFAHYYLQDNNWASTLGQVGWPGTLAFLSIFASIFIWSRKAYAKATEKKFRFMALAAMVVTLGYAVLGLFACNFVIRLIAFNYWALAGMLVGGIQNREARTSAVEGPGRQ